MQCSIHVKVNFEKKKSALLTEKFQLFSTSKEYDNKLYTFHSVICQVVAHGRLKTKENFKFSALKVVTVAYERWSFTGGYNYSDLI